MSARVSKTAILPRRTADDMVGRTSGPIQADVVRTVTEIEARLQRNGADALRAIGESFGDLAPGQPLIATADDLAEARASLDREARRRLSRIASRIRRFAEAQRASLSDVAIEVPGGQAGHRWTAVERAGCYAPGGRYPLASSVLMTAIPARVAGVEQVWLASPNPDRLTLAAAAEAGCDGVLRAGGAQAILALANGIGVPAPCDVVVGPGNRYVVAAKQRIAGRVGIDALAGPSELVVVADESADPEWIAADLLAQAEHDPDAVLVAIVTNHAVAERVEAALMNQLTGLPTVETARASLAHGGLVVVEDLGQAAWLVDRLAPEHLELRLGDPQAVLGRIRHFGAVFVGAAAPTVIGDYGVGPNHTLPTGRAARCTSGLSVLTFLRPQTWVDIDDPENAAEVYQDSAWLARQEGLEAHARSAERRLTAATTGTEP